ncbi:DoxX family membrane protein [Chitinophaga arvensicola]|uniref:Thiosulfate dehydrogenase [quinone] large subunit n=1 Tax=Chitinophaga arvensicola TaxID=29529 RepID=A0A1I0NLA1_9BACT|nr:DoxX family membrane protein [Chitinophaga arvensicola]SEW02219.1 thiosulfate dehydrogenase [quinone] large subunit [Chitinophaga arvensicola]
MENNAIVFLLLRLAVAASMFGHGLVRLPKLNGFSAWMVKSFEKSMLPDLMVVPFSYALPIAEFVIGLLLLLGLFTRVSLIGGGVVMVLLIFGSAMIENWDPIPSQLIHAAFFGLLLVFIQYNTLSVDHLIKK